MGLRSDFQTLLLSLEDGINVYFQPPENIQMVYPAIVYNRDYSEVDYADNLPYSITRRYLVTVIDQNPDSPIVDKVAALPMSKFNRHYTTANLNHDAYYVYF